MTEILKPEPGVTLTLRRSGYEPMQIAFPTADLDWSDPIVAAEVLPEILMMVPKAIAELVAARGPQPRKNRAARRRQPR